MNLLIIVIITLLERFVYSLPDYNSTNYTNAPIIESLVNEIQLPFGVTWNVSCKFSQPVVWKPYDAWFDWTPPNVTSIAFSTGEAEMQYGATLTISNATAAVVGRYYCVTSEKKDEDLEEMLTKNFASSVYVFVKDYKQPLVPTTGLIYYIQNEEVFIPCKPSYPDKPVEVCSKVGECLTTPVDVTKGFRLSKSQFKIPDDGTLVCKSDNASYSIKLLTAPTLELIDGEIELPFGVTRNIICKSSNPIVWKAYDAYFDWNPANVKSTPFSTDDKEMQYGSILTITNATAASVGRYYCVESGKSQEDLDEMITQEFATSVYVFVIDHNQPLVPVNYETMKRNRTKRFVIPCKPSYREVNVELCYESGRFCMTKCDPSRGFSIYDETFHTSLEAFVCRCNQARNYIPKLDVTGIPKPSIASDTKGIVPLGKRISLVCSVTLVPSKKIEMTWKTLPNYQPIDKNERIHVGQMIVVPHPELYNRELATRELIIQNATLEDKRTYRCEVSDDQYNVNYHSYRVNVRDTSDDYVLLSGMNHKAVINRRRNTNGEFKPIDIFVKYRSYPSNITYLWSKDDIMLIDGIFGKYRMEQTENYVRLTINDPTVTDTGVYTTVVNAGAGTNHFSIEVYVHDKPSVRMESKYSILGDEVEFTCNVVGYPLPNVRIWYQHCEKVPWENCSYAEDTRIDGKAVVKSSGIITKGVKKIIAEHPGHVYCMATNSEGNETAQGYLLVSGMTSKIQLERIPADSLITVGDNVTFICSLINVDSANIPTNLRFLNNDNELSESDRVLQSFSHDSIFFKSQLTLMNVSLDMSGQMTCRIKSKDAYNTSKPVQFEVVAPIAPRLLSGKEHDSIEKKVSESLVLQCNVSGIPQPEVAWFKEGRAIQLQNNTMRLLVNESVLSIDSLEKNDFGLYECRAKNKAGNITQTWNVQEESTKVKGWIIGVVIFAVVCCCSVGLCCRERIKRGCNAFKLRPVRNSVQPDRELTQPIHNCVLLITHHDRHRKKYLFEDMSYKI